MRMKWAKVKTGENISPLVFAMPKLPAESQAKPSRGKEA